MIVRHIGKALKGATCFLSVLVVLGCTELIPAEELPVLLKGEGESDEVASATDSPVLPKVLSSSLKKGSLLANTAGQIDRVAVARSSKLQEIQAAEADYRARRFDRYPQLRPTASAPLIGSERPSIGLRAEQLLWDGGRLRAQLTDAQMQIALATLEAWQERNATVYEGLSAYVDWSLYTARVNILEELDAELRQIADLLQTRFDGGVADRGELIRMNATLQEVQRRIVADSASKRKAKTEFSLLLPGSSDVDVLSDLGAAAQQCSRAWQGEETPVVALAQLSVSRAELTEGFVGAKRFPKILLTGGSNYSSGGWSKPSVGIELDASDMLGLGRKENLAAAEASTRSAIAAYEYEKDKIAAELAQLDVEYSELNSDKISLRGLIQRNLETLELYTEQLEAGTISLSDGAVFHREKADTLVAFADVEADIISNCLRSSELRGLLAPIRDNDGKL